MRRDSRLSRFLSVFLAITLVTSLNPVAAYATTDLDIDNSADAITATADESVVDEATAGETNPSDINDAAGEVKTEEGAEKTEETTTDSEAKAVVEEKVEAENTDTKSDGEDGEDGEDGDEGESAKAVATIDDSKFETLEAAFAAAGEGDTIVLQANASPALTSQRAITKASVIDLNDKTLTLTEDDLYFGTTTFKNGNIVVDPSVKPSTAVFWMFANQTLTFDDVKLVATGVAGTYLIGLDGNNSDLNLLNGSEIFINNDTALDLDVICVNASTGNDIVIDNSKVNVTNLDGRVFFRGNYTVKGSSDIDLAGITKAGFRIEAGQTLSIEDTATVDIVGEPRDGGIHLTDKTAAYTVADTATVNAVVNEPAAAAMVGGVKYASLDEAFNAAQDGDEVTILVAGTYALSTSGKSITITGAVDGVVFDNIGAKNMGSASVTFNNVAFDYYPNVNYTGLQHSGNLVYNDCTFDGQVFLYGASETFNRCTFNQNSADAYNVWTYGAKEVDFNECTFNCVGKAVLIYAESASITNDVAVADCDFVASAPVEGKAAIEMDSSLTGGITLTIDEETDAIGFGSGNVSGNSLWNNKKGNEGANNDITVTVADEVVLKPTPAIVVTFTDGYTMEFDSLAAAMSVGYSGGAQEKITVYEDITEEMDFLEGNIVSGNPNGVTITNTIVDEWIYCSENFTIGEGVTYDATGAASGLFMYAEDAVINGTVLTDCYYQRYADTKLTINEPGSMTVKTETFIVRYMDGDADAGIYIVGDNNDETIGLNASVIYFYQGMINAKDADIRVGTYWQTNETDGAGSANLVLDNSNMIVTVNEHNMKATGNSTVTLTNGSAVSVAGGFEAGEAAVIKVDSTSSITKNGVSVFVAEIDGAYYTTLQAAVNAAVEGDTISMLRDATITDELELKNVTLKGNGFKLTNNGTVSFTDGEFDGVKIDGTGTTKFYGENNFYGACEVISTTVNGGPFHLVVNKGATLLISRFVLGYDRHITVYGEIEDAHALTADEVAAMTPSLKFNSTSGVSIGGTDTGKLTVYDAYVELGSSSSKNAAGTYEWSFDNSYVSATSFCGFNGPTDWTVTFDDSVLAAKSYIKIGEGTTHNYTNGSAATTGSMRVDGVLNIDETSSITVTNAQNNVAGTQDEHGDISGVVNVAGELNIKGASTQYVELLDGELNVNGGIVNIDAKGLNIDTNSVCVINGGALNSAVEVSGKLESTGDVSGAITKSADDAKIEIYAGTYAQDVSEWCADGYIAVDKGDGTYGVKAATEAWILRNNVTKFYGTLAEAIADARDGETVMLSANVLVDSVITIDKNITLADYGALSVSFAGNGAFHITKANELTLDKVIMTDAPVYADSNAAGAKVNGQLVNGVEKHKSTVTSDGSTVTVTNPDWAAQVGETYYMSLQDAVNAAVAGDNTITLLKDCSDDVTIKQTEGVNIVIAGNNKAYSGTFYIHGNARHTGAETLTFQNFKFETGEAAHDFISANSTGSVERYAHNVTVKDSSFSATAENNEVVGLRMRQAYNVKIENVTANGMHSVMWATGGTGSTVDRLVSDCANGISFGTVDSVVVKNSEIKSDSYGIRADGSGAYSMSVESSTIEAAQPVVVRKATGAYELNVGEGNELTSTKTDGYAITVTEGDDGVAPVNPTGDFKLTGADDLRVYPVSEYVAEVDGANYMSLQDALKAVKADSVVNILKDVTITEDWDARYTGGKITVPVTIIGNGHTLKFTGKVYDAGNHMAVFRFEAAATVNGLTVDMSEAQSGFNTRFRAISAKSDLTVSGCTFIGNGSANNTRAIIFGEGAGANVGKLNISVTDSKFIGWRLGISDNENGQDVKAVSVTGNTFEDANVNISAAEDIAFTGNETDGYVTILSHASETKLNVTATGNHMAAHEKTYVKNAVSYDNVQSEFSIVAKAIVTNGDASKHYNTLQAAIDAAKDGDVITLLADCAEDVMVTQAPDVKVTIDGGDKTMSGTITVNGKSARYETAALTIKNVKFDATSISKDASINLGGNNNIRYTNNVTVEDCSFTGAGQAKVGIKQYTGGCHNLVVTGCTATGLHSLMQLKNVEKGLVVDGCTVTESKNGVSLGASSGAAVTGCTIQTTGYGIRADGSGAYEATVSDCTITAEKPIVVRNATGDYTLNIGEGNALATTVEGGYQVTFTAGDDGDDPVNPTGAFEINGDLSELNVFPVPTADLQYAGYVGATGEQGTDSYRENIQVDLYGVYAVESLVVELWSGDVKLTTTSLREVDRDDESVTIARPIAGDITANIVVSGRLSGSWDTEWHKSPSVELMPTAIKAYADGILVDTWEGGFIDEAEAAKYAALTGVAEARADLSEATVEAADFAYTGEKATPELTVTLGGKVLDQNTDFVATCDSIEVGKATVTITGKGSYKGEKTVEFNIVHTDLLDAYTDLDEDAWYMDQTISGTGTLYLDYVLANGLMNGTSATTFDPDGNLTRAQTVTILYRLAGSPAVSGTESFTDVVKNSGSSWYYDAVIWAVNEGITTGTSATTFDPNGKVTREQLATFIWRFCGKPAGSTSAKSFADSAQIDSYAVAAMSWCYDRGIMAGIGNNKIDPNGYATRAAMAKMISVTAHDVLVEV